MDTTLPYKLIQEWWGEPFSRDLADRISSAPKKHVWEFIRFAEDAPCGELAKLQPGVIRPFLKNRSSNIKEMTSNLTYLETTLKLLLYADEVVIEDPIQYIGSGLVLDWLHSAKPFADAGMIKFVHYPRIFNHPSRTHGFTNYLDDALQELPDGIEIAEEIVRFTDRARSYDLSQQIFRAKSSLGMSLEFSKQSPGTFNMLIESAEEALLLPIGIHRAKIDSPELQALRLSKLAALDLPMLNANGIWSVRESSEEFSRWRAALGEAMRDIDFMSSSDPTWQSKAKNLMLSELRPIQAELDKAVRKSSALSAMKVGVAGLGYAAVGATAGALAGGRITTSLVGAAAGRAPKH